MSFWVSKSYSVSAVDQILDKGSFSLEELLDAQEIVQETQSLNGRLIAYLQKPETVRQLLEYVVVPPGGEKKDGKNSNQVTDKSLKIPAMACEVFCCEARSLFDTLLSDASLMEKLFSILDLPEPLDCVMAGYFARVVYCLYTKRIDRGQYEQSVEVIDYLQRNPSIISKLISHIGSTSIAEVLLRFLGADENSATPVPPSKLSWMLDHSFLEELIEQLSPTKTLDAQHNAAYILSGIVRGNFSPLVSHLTQRPETLQQIFKFAFESSENHERGSNPVWKPGGAFGAIFQPLPRRRPALDICIGLLDAVEKDWGSAEEAESPSSQIPFRGISAECRELALKEMKRYMPELKAILQGEGINLENQTIPTPYGVLQPPMSSARLKAVEIASSTLLTQDKECCEALWHLGILKLLLQLFLQYPFHNMLHRQIFGIISLILQDESEEMLKHVLEDCKLVDWLVNAPEQIPLGGSHGTGKTARAGYLGHVTHLANQVANLSEKGLVAEAIGKSEKWKEWAETTLKARNKAEDTMQWVCGRPQRPIVASVQSSEDMEGSLQDNLTFRDVYEDEAQNSNSWPSVEWADFPSSNDNQMTWPDDSQKGVNRTTNLGMRMGDSGFRSIDLDDGLKVGSSSSSDSDDEISFRPSAIPSASRTFATFGDASSEDEDTVIVNSNTRTLLPDAGFTDFDDFGGLHNASHTDSAYWQQASKTLSLVDVSLSDDSPNSIERDDPDSAQLENATESTWDAFQPPNSPSDPTDFGWASFPSDTGNNTSAHRADDAEVVRQDRKDTESREEELGNSDEKSSHSHDSQPKLIPSCKTVENSEFSSFNYWRQPMLQFEEND